MYYLIVRKLQLSLSSCDVTCHAVVMQRSSVLLVCSSVMCCVLALYSVVDPCDSWSSSTVTVSGGSDTCRPALLGGYPLLSSIVHVLVVSMYMVSTQAAANRYTNRSST